MQRERNTGLASIALGFGIAANAVLGPLVLGVIRIRESATMETQLLGGELTSLFLAAPIACVAGILWWRGNRLAPALGIGPAGFALYTYVQYVLVPDYSRYPGNNERFFPLYLLLIVLSGWLVWRSWHELWAGRVAQIPPRVSRLYGAMLIALNGAFAIAWIASIAFVMAGRPTPEYQEQPTAFWLIRLMDLGFMIPFALITGRGLIRLDPWATRSGYAFAGPEALIASAVSGMAIRMWVRDDPAFSPTLLATSTIAAVAFMAVYATLLYTVARGAFRSHAPPAVDISSRRYLHAQRLSAR